ncbi:MAG: DUF6528 family protein [Bosea sp. (in: a-proteobacteria)]
MTSNITGPPWPTNLQNPEHATSRTHSEQSKESTMNPRLTPFMVIALALSAPTQLRAAAAEEAFFACGSNQVVLYGGAPEGFKPGWSWKSDDPAFAKIDECKVVDDGATLLVTASTGGVAIVERKDGGMRFRTDAFMAHSAELLPLGRLAVAVSTHDTGNRLVVYDPPRRDPIITIPFYAAHGVLWDKKRQRLYASGGDQLVEYGLGDWSGASPALTQMASTRIPGRAGGHDLSRLDDDHLLQTTTDGVWVFDQATGQFAPFEPLNALRDVKSVDVERNSGRIVYQKATTSWWAHEARLARPDAAVPTPGIRLYKVRWLHSAR